MQLGMIGFGRMGTGMARPLMKDGHQGVVWDRKAEAVKKMEAEGAVGGVSWQEFVQKLTKPRAAWMMVPAAVVDQILDSLLPLLERDDIVIDGGNSHYHDDIRRARELEKKGIHYVDVGTSGGVWGFERGFCQMIGGEQSVVQHLDPVFRSLAPAVDSSPRTPGREKVGGTAEHGAFHCGPGGAGHFAQMVHNGTENGLM